MSYNVLYFNDAESILKAKRMFKMVEQTFAEIEQDLGSSLFPAFTLKATMTDCDWRENPDSLKIIEGRRYRYKGFRNRIAIEAGLGAYEFILEGLFRLQVGFDKGLIDAGILILNGSRSEKSPIGNSLDLVENEVKQLYPTISLPVAVALFDIGMPRVESDAIAKELPDDFYDEQETEGSDYDNQSEDGMQEVAV